MAHRKLIRQELSHIALFHSYLAPLLYASNPITPVFATTPTTVATLHHIPSNLYLRPFPMYVGNVRVIPQPVIVVDMFCQGYALTSHCSS